MADVFSLPVFPAADVFPMMGEDELQELAADIKANGLRDPLVVATIGDEIMLVDGRNRRAACKAVGVEPATRKLNGEDPTAFVVSANIHRRNMTKGQRAMAYAMIYPEATAYKRGGANSVKITELSEAYVSHARTVLKHTPDAAKLVLAGASLDDAYKDAIARKKAADTDEARIATMRAEAPDLADLIVEDRMKPGEAWAAFEKRQQDKERLEASARETMLRLSEAAYRGIVAWGNAEFANDVRSRLTDDKFRDEFISRLRPVPAEIKAISKGAVLLFSVLKDMGLIE